MNRRPPDPVVTILDAIQTVLLGLLDRVIDGFCFAIGAAAAILVIRIAGVEVWP